MVGHSPFLSAAGTILCAYFQLCLLLMGLSFCSTVTPKHIAPRRTMLFHLHSPSLNSWGFLSWSLFFLFLAESYLFFKLVPSSLNAFLGAPTQSQHPSSGLQKHPHHATIVAVVTFSWTYLLWMLQSPLLDFKVFEGRKVGTQRCSKR